MQTGLVGSLTSESECYGFCSVFRKSWTPFLRCMALSLHWLDRVLGERFSPKLLALVDLDVEIPISSASSWLHSFRLEGVS